MRIVNITPGLISIPPNGWGAVEKIIWEIHNNLIDIGHTSDIKYLSEVNKYDYDIIHIHVANLANEAHKRGIPYYFTMHDHHVYLYGKDSALYLENYNAIKNSILSFLPAKYLVDYFGLKNATYLSHGVNLNKFTPKSEIKKDTHSILCVANNGYANNPTYDRKGFLLAIETAKRLDLPITICGPVKNNFDFFNKHNPEYEKLTVKYDLTEQDLYDEYKKHTIFLHLSELEAGHPNLTILESMASGLVVVATLEESTVIPGLIKTDRLIDSSVNSVKYAISSYDRLLSESLKTIKQYDWVSVTKRLLSEYKYNKETIRHKFINIYNKYIIKPNPIKEIDNRIIFNFNNGPYVEILGTQNKEYNVKFIERQAQQVYQERTKSSINRVDYETNIRNNNWSRANTKFYTNWKLEVSSENKMIFEHIFDCTGKNIHIKFESSSLGDTLAWIPYVDEFRKKFNCHVYCSTFHNKLFITEYPEIKFVQPGTEVFDCYASYCIGWYYNADGSLDYSKNPVDVKSGPLQKTAADILGLKYEEIKPKISMGRVNFDRIQTIKNKYPKLVTIGTQATIQAKYWNNPKGWEELVIYLQNKGYTVACIDKHPAFGSGDYFNYLPKGVLDLTGNIALEVRVEQILSSEFFIGLGSGLSWLSWALGKKTVVISGFSYPYTEMKDCIRISAPPDKCSGCFNRHRLDPSNWIWCPDHQNTNRMFECSKSITAFDVITKIEKELNI